MGYDLYPTNENLESFQFGAFSWTHLLEQCGSYFACTQHGPQWYCVWEQDKRMGDDYPMILSNDGFPVTAEESLVLARIARNYAAMQRTLDASHTLTDVSLPDFAKPWPRKIREDWVDLFERFAEWSEQSGGFEIH